MRAGVKVALEGVKARESARGESGERARSERGCEIGWREAEGRRWADG